MENKVGEFQNGFIGKYFVKNPRMFLISFIAMIFIFSYLCLNITIPIYKEVQGVCIDEDNMIYKLDNKIEKSYGKIFFYNNKKEKVYQGEVYQIWGDFLKIDVLDDYNLTDKVIFEIQSDECTLLEVVFLKGGNL